MLYVVHRKTDAVLGKWDAWYINAEEEARALIKDGGYKVIEQEITPFGNMIVWVM